MGLKLLFFNGNNIYFLAQMIPLVTNTIPSKMVDNSSNVSYCDVVGQTQLSSNPSYVILLWCIVSFIFVAFLCIFDLIFYYSFLSKLLPRVFYISYIFCKYANVQTWFYIVEYITYWTNWWIAKSIIEQEKQFQTFTTFFCLSWRGFLECCKKFDINSYFYSGFALNVMFRLFFLVKTYESFATSNKRTLQKDIFYAFINYSDSND